MNLKGLKAAAGLLFLTLSNVSMQAQATEAMLELATARGCTICHSVAANPDGGTPMAPSYQDIAARYRGSETAYETLAERVLYGTIGKKQNWGGKLSMRFMPPNVNITRTDSINLVRWILSLQGASPISDELKKHESMVSLATTSGCVSCHRISPIDDPRLIELAPSFREVAAYYEGDKEAHKQLLDSVENGTVNKPKTWGNVNMRFMPPNVNLRKEDAKNLVDWILKLDHQGVKVPSIAKH